jgi:hypothetical protein
MRQYEESCFIEGIERKKLVELAIWAGELYCHVHITYSWQKGTYTLMAYSYPAGANIEIRSSTPRTLDSLYDMLEEDKEPDANDGLSCCTLEGGC